ncbi:hypothetical protein [Alkalilimnicola sp. S0819]|uniref:hypothetical protein n=1 Tax=Alkalilimnicola sp. S0819 TaxID=2613922 RepID=UPI001261C8CF|nr:hypothetical protein [Alkalilimnicola sp. S0819]KAB7619472.1 hypothetical protein F3N43_13705 [Alkalilimnicola sp. S0819]MPQ17692.1 hypothetical protein [Alkalilimnicola sp. S0819]
MTIRLLLCALVATISLALSVWFAGTEVEVVGFYEKNLRGNLFAGFLTVGGFLLSLKTFIVIKLKENVYGHRDYKALFDSQKKLDSSIRLYDPLRNLSEFLYWSVLSSIVAAIAQLTIGLFGNYWLTLLAIWFAVFAMSVLVASLLLIKRSLNDWFEFINRVDS